MASIRYLLKLFFSDWRYRKQVSPAAFKNLLAKIPSNELQTPSSAEADLFTYHGEDGIIQFLLQHIKDLPSSFVDIGAGDGIKGNCTTVAIHQNWTGLFIDANPKQLDIGRRFYKKMRKPVHFLEAFASPENINGLIQNAGFSGGIGILSIDIDGNDYWIWKSISVIRPRIVIVEAKVEFGERTVVVPYATTNNRNHDPQYNGASVEALRQLGATMGYSLVAANRYGYNLFFVSREHLLYPLKEWTASDVLRHAETIQSFYGEDFFRQHGL